MREWNCQGSASSAGACSRVLAALGIAVAVRMAAGQAIVPVDISAGHPGDATATPTVMEPAKTVSVPATASLTATTRISQGLQSGEVGGEQGNGKTEGGERGNGSQVAQAITPIDIATQPAATLPAVAPPAVVPPATAPAIVATPTSNPATAPAVVATPTPTPVTLPATVAAPTPTPVTPVTPPATVAATEPATTTVAGPGTAPVTPATPVTPVATPATPPATGTAIVETSPATAPAATAPVIVDLGKPYKIPGGIKVAYKNQNSQQPPIDDLLNTDITLGVLNDGYVAANTPGASLITLKLGEVGAPGAALSGTDLVARPTQIYRSGIAAIYGQIVRYFNARSIIGVFVVVDGNDIDSNDSDIRPPDRTTLQFIVVTSVVKQIRTVSIGEGTTDADRVNNPKHAFILEHSPLKAAPPATTQAATQGGTEAPNPGEQDLLRKDVLDDYVLRLNRQPGRRVDVAVSGTGDPGGVTLDYLVSENRPWYVYGQISNTGTKQTNEWRERFGFVDNQLTGHDDVLSLDYMTAGFASTHAVILSYEAPFLDFERVRYKMYGSWNEFTASDVGQNNENFTGNQWTAGDELIMNFLQRRELFVDFVMGNRYSGIQTDNVTAQTQGRANYYEPYFGFRADRTTDIAATTADMTLVGYITDDSQKSIDGLGRADTSRTPVVLQFDAAQSFYLEPVLFPQSFAAGSSTLAHEIYISARGQFAFNDRLFPQAEDIAGGLYTVRGYPESISAGDSVVAATLEYRFHLPRILPIQSDPSKTPFLWENNFRFSPQQAYGRPDWDLILRAFVDAGQVMNSHRETFEKNATLVGTGVGLELQYKQNVNFRVDWGAALTDIPDEVKTGSNRFHISTTILY